MTYLILIQILMIFEVNSDPVGTALQKNQLEVIVKNVRPQKGHVRVCLFDNKNDFFNKALKCYDVDAPEYENSILVIFNGLKNSRHAVAVYQDYNQNGILDRNWLGLPKEPYGFSNNPSTYFGPPGFLRASFEMKESKTIIISL
jgi:uncharacterized protein (DUF2141 family)